MCVSGQSKAQNSQSQSLINIINSMEKKFNIDILYDSKLLYSVELDSIDLNTNFNEIIDELNKKSAFKFEIVDDNSVVVSPVKPGANTKISLVIIDEDANEPVPGALLKNSDGTKANLSNENGLLILYGSFSSNDTLVLSSYGFSDTKIPVNLINKGSTILIPLKPKPNVFASIEISPYVTKGININTVEHSLEIDIDELALIAGEIENDILQSIKILPGMNTPTGRAGELNMRGSTHDQSLIYFDGIPLYHSGHYHGTLSPFNPFTVKKIQVYRNGHSSDMDGRVGGSIVINTDSEIPDSAKYGFISSTIFAGGYLNIPILKNKLSLSVSGRHNIPGLMSPKLKSTQGLAQAGTFSHLAQELDHQSLELDKFVVKDFNTKLIFEPHQKHHFEFSGLYIDNTINSHVLENGLNKIVDHKTLTNWGFSGLWKYQLNNNLSTNLSVVRSDFTYFSEFDTYDTTGALNRTSYFNTSVDDFNTKASIEYIPEKNSTDKFTIGLEYKWMNSNQEILNLGPSSSVVISDTKLNSYGLFSTYKFNRNKLTLLPGIRSYYLPNTDYLRLEPRLKASFYLDDNTVLKSSYGKYSQVSNLEYEVNYDVYIYTNYFWDITTKQVPVVKSDISMLGLIKDLGSWTIDLEAYHKFTKDVFYRYQPNYFLGNVTTNGMDVMVKKHWDKLDIWSKYTLSKTELNFPEFSNVPFLTHFDQTHQVSLGSYYQVGNWNFALSWRYASGVPNYLNGSPIPFIPPTNPPLNLDPTNPKLNNGRFGDQHQLDASISMDFPQKTSKWKGNISLSVMNIYDRNNIVQTVNHRQGKGNYYLLDRSNVGITPNLQLRIEW